MAYRFNTGDEPVSNQLHRIFLEEVDSALGHLQGEDNRDHRIHEARKNIKKIRALLRLVAGPLGKRAFQKENRRFRDIGRKISELRDAQAIIESFAALPENAVSLKLKSSFQKQLESKKSQVYERLDVDDVLRCTVSALQKARPHLTAFSIGDKGFSSLDFGFLEIYRQGRKALKTARETQSADHLHSLRKRVKDHWYHTRLLKETQIQFLQGRQSALRELETLLGEAHNLHVLQLAFEETSEAFRRKPPRKLLDICKTRESDLSAQALALGASLYAMKSRRLKQELRGLHMH